MEFSIVAANRGVLFIVVHRLLIAVASLLAEHGLESTRAQQLWHMGLIDSQHVESSQTRD